MCEMKMNFVRNISIVCRAKFKNSKIFHRKISNLKKISETLLLRNFVKICSELIGNAFRIFNFEFKFEQIY